MVAKQHDLRIGEVLAELLRDDGLVVCEGAEGQGALAATSGLPMRPAERPDYECRTATCLLTAALQVNPQPLESVPRKAKVVAEHSTTRAEPVHDKTSIPANAAFTRRQLVAARLEAPKEAQDEEH